MSDTRKKILLLPSYWPTKRAPVVGAQVYEQTELMSDEYEYCVFFCLPGMGWKRHLWHRLVRLITGKQIVQSCEGEHLSGSLRSRGVYYYQSKFFSYKKNRELEYRAYKYLLEQSIREGWKPDMIHTRTAEFAGVNAARLAKTFDIPLLLTENCIFVLTDNLSIDRIKDYQYAIESADTVAVVSNYLKAQLLTNNFKCRPLLVGNWINEARFRLREDGKKDSFTILNIGHTGFTKDWPTFFEAMRYLINDLGCRNVRITLAVTHVFDDESRNYVPKLAKEYGLCSFCDIVFQVPRNEVIELYRRSDVFVSTSVNETFGIATCEAMFCGLPVVATANGGIDDFISDRNGIKTEIGDAIGIAKAVKTLYDGAKRYDPQEVRDSVLHKFGTEAFRGRLSALYTKTMER